MLHTMQQLPSPPSTSHRGEKENKPLLTHNSRVSWSQENKIHSIPSSPSFLNVKSSASCLPPKSILRKVTNFPFTDLSYEVEREITPEPSSPLSNASYLAGPVSRIVPLDASLKDVIQGYNVLAARIREAITSDSTIAIDASVPLFQPLKDNAEGFVNAVIRDLGRVTIKPFEKQEPEVKSSLPSPRPSPRKKKGGMNEEQAKHARDLSTATNSVIKLLALLFSTSAVCQLFSDDQLSSILTGLLAIPMADELPARKTCALSIWFFQVQRLPATVLAPAKDRIAYALRRGMEGELGKEGKKGSASDALQAVHVLSAHEPSIFVPVFTGMLTSILSKLLAPTISLRIEACLALGGFVVGLISLPRSYVHTRISNAVAEYLLTPPTISFSHESIIVRILRKGLNNQDPVHPVQGPVWALSVIACFLVMLGPRAYMDTQLSRVFNAQASLAMRHKKSSIRAMGCLLWRCISWVYFQPPLIAKDPDAVEDDEGEEEASCSSQEQDSQILISRRQYWWKLVHGVIDMGAGVSTIVGLLAELKSPSSPSSSEGLAAIIKTLSLMVKKGGSTCIEALQIIGRLVPDTSEESVEQDSPGEMDECDWATLVPKAFFYSFAGLLTADFRSLSAVVKPIFDYGAAVEDIRSLTQEELAENDVFKGLVRVWRDSLKAMEIEGCAAPPQDMLDIWRLLLRAKLEQVKDSDSDSRMFAEQVSTLLRNIVSDETIRPSPISNCDFDDLPSPTSSPIKPAPAPRSNSALRLFLVRYLWKGVQSVLPEELMLIICVSFLGYLKEHHDSLVPITDLHPEGEEDTRHEWGTLCAEVLINIQVSSIEKFLGSAKIFRHDLDQVKRWVKEMRGLAWRSYIVKWMEGEEDWEEGISVLLLPIVSGDEPWTLTDDDIKTWEILLSYTLSKALDNSVEPHSVLEQIANQISRYYKPTWTSATRIVDLIISDLDVANYKDVPLGVMELANDTLISSYPPEPRNKVLSSWLIRSITRVVDECPPSLVTQVLESIQEGLSLWISDGYKSFTPDEYEFDMVISYQTALFAIQSQTRSSELVETFAEIIGSAFRGRPDKPNAISEAFQEFWMCGYAEASEPEDGWPSPVKLALQASAFWHDTANVDRDRDPPGDEENSLANKESITNLAQEVLGQPEIQTTITPSTEIAVVSSDFSPHHPGEIRKPLIPFTPQSCRHATPSTPTHRHKFSSSPFRLANNGDSSPLMDLKRVPVLSLYSSPANIKKCDKENVQHVVVDSPRTSILGKRKLEDTIDDSAVYVKRKVNGGSQTPVHRKQHGTMGGTITKPTPRDYLEENMAQDTSSPTSVKPTVVSKKRKIEYLFAVEVPTYRQVLKARRIASDNLSSSSTTSAPPVSVRRTRSATKLLGESTGYQSDLPRKKPRMALQDNSDSSESDTSLHDIQIVGSDDSIVLANSVADDRPPSDDDPVNPGNVTPHLVVSPSLGSKRVHNQRWDESDPPSDDSISGPESPSKQLVKRRQQRFWNMGIAPDSTLVL